MTAVISLSSLMNRLWLATARLSLRYAVARVKTLWTS